VVSPLIVPAVAIALTLLYASYRDIRERRVPFRTWYPVFLVIIPVSILFYAFFLLQLDIFQFLSFMVIIIAVTAGLVVCDYRYTRYKYREKPSGRDLFDAGIVWLIFSIPLSSVLFGFLTDNVVPISIAALLFCFIAFVFGIYFFGGADYIALLVIGVGVPLFPVEPLAGYPLINYFPWSAFLNALILNIIAPAGIFFFNRYHSRQAPLRYQFLGFPVKGEEIQNAYGFVMEVIEEEGGVIHRRFLTIREMMKSLSSRNQRIYTKDLRTNPEKYAEELEIYKKAGTVWISYGVPFIVPITAGFMCAIFIGDLVLIIMKFVAG
jgi:preflagellin peptidase FlaK